MEHVMAPKEARARVNQNGRIVIPASFRRALKIKSGDTVVLRLDQDKDEMRITTLRKQLAETREFLKKHVKPGSSVVDELIADRREAARRELEE
jgi:AbrB family looped-hinge helix DNA binding protein